MAEIKKSLNKYENSTKLHGPSKSKVLDKNVALDNGHSENDATHFRLRKKFQSFGNLTCLSCGDNFQSTSLLQVYEHYSEKAHVFYFANCFYCLGKVHRYFDNSKQQTLYYHDCLRWKRGDDR